MNHQQYWMPPALFLAIAIPVGLALMHFNIGGEYQLILAIVAGGVPVQFLYRHLARQAAEQRAAQAAPPPTAAAAPAVAGGRRKKGGAQ
ncbi:MAG: hypothetical protein ACK5QH_00495 [Rubrivivax sp.]|jgi:hypothetical protein